MQVYLCLRVLLCRITEQHLSSLWPIILTEMLRLFETLLEDRVPTSPEYLQLILAACKFLDALLVLQTEDFQIHEWIFVTDTTDAMAAPSSLEASAVIDRIAAVLQGTVMVSPRLGDPHIRHAAQASHPQPLDAGSGLLRRPLLDHLRQNDKLESLTPLEPFFASVSRTSFEAVYSKRGVDWAATVQGIESDMFEG
jgi:hypothetical protein